MAQPTVLRGLNITMWPAQMPAVAAQTLHYNSTENPELS